MRSSVINREPLIHISRRSDISRLMTIIIKAVTIVVALILCGLISNAFAPGSFFTFYQYVFEGTLYSPNTILSTLWNAALLLLIAVAITPAFKMKFWNIGAEGQCLMGALGTLIALKFIAPHVPNFIALVIEVIMAATFAIIWSVIPAFFNARFKTNETLFTLMMNYIAMGLVAACVVAWSTSGSNVLGVVNNTNHEGWLPFIGDFGNSYILNIILVVVAAICINAYLKFSQHGYELSVVGGSRNTAKYLGINAKMVIIRTMLLTGSLCGLAGFLMVAGASHTITSSLVGGRGFTAILVAWLGDFNVPFMLIYSFLVSFVSIGSSNAAAWIGYSSTISNVLTGIFFLLVIISNFFINFRLHIKLPKFKKKEEIVIEEPVAQEEIVEEKEGNK